MSGRRGFTLVELLVTSSMLSVLAAAGYVVLTAGVQSSQKVRRVSGMAAHAQRALNAMAADVRTAVAHGDVRLTALDANYEGAAADTLDFIAPRGGRFTDDPDAGSRCEIGYYIDNDPDTEAQWLLRRRDDSLDDDPLEGGAVNLIGPFVSELDLSFFDGLDWVPGWEDQEQFTRAVRITIVVMDPDEAERPLHFETTVSIPTR